VGRAGSLTADPLRLPGAGAAGLVLRRLDRDAAGAVPLRFAARALAPLTCLRLEALLEPSRGDEALAAVLARYGAEAPNETEGAERHAADLPFRRGRAPSGETHSVPAPAEARRSAPLTRAPEKILRHAPPQPRRARAGVLFARAIGDGEPLASRTAGSARPVEGLEWLVDRVPGGREATERPLELAEPRHHVAARDEAQRSRPRPAPTAQPGVRVLPALEPSRTTRELAAASQPPASELQHSIAVTPGPERSRGPAAEHGLAALVRSWNGQSEEPAVESVAADSAAPLAVLHSEDVVVDRAPLSRRRRPAGASPEEAVAAEELLGLGDELGRVLVAELRRYGIEVGP